MTPSVKPDGVIPSRKLVLKAANDNRPSLTYRLKKVLTIGTPLAMIAFFAAVWYFGSN